jgi:drug/metabolite transporter (DMT)-like permease
MNNQNQPLKVWAGLITLYLVWGSTYLGIRFVVESVPSMMASGFRNFLAGFVLFTFSILSGKYQKPSRKMLITTAFAGLFMLTLGNGLFTITAKWVPSSYSALFSALGPVKLVILLCVFDNDKPNKKVVIGAVLGIIGVCILMSLKSLALKGYEQYYGLGIVLLFFAVLGWNIGVVIVKKADINEYHASQIAGTQMIIGGFLSLIISYFWGEFDNFHVESISSKALWAFIYLLTFGSIIAFLVFSWLSKVAPPTLVATYTYVNPLVAMFLGWLLAGEKLHPLMILSGAIIVTAVILITSVSGKKNIPQDFIE